jgi:hypothetical protein
MSIIIHVTLVSALKMCYLSHIQKCVSSIALLLAGLWLAWFLPMLRGEMLPKMPSEPPVVHIIAGQQVPYTPEAQEVRTAGHKVKKATWNKTMKVIIATNSECVILLNHVTYTRAHIVRYSVIYGDILCAICIGHIYVCNK